MDGRGALAHIKTMPELPEVETVMRGLEPVLTGRTIARIETRRADLRVPFPKDLKKTLEGARIMRLSRRAKYCLIHLQGGVCLVVHLGMSGRLVITRDHVPVKHDHFLITLEDGAQVVLNDPRRFGMVLLVPDNEMADHASFRHLGPEPLGNAFNADYLRTKLRGRTQAIKLTIMDQRIVVGVGNIYACEALYRAGIDPAQPAGSVSSVKLEKLVNAIRAVLSEAIAAGGSSLKDYVQASGELGYFQHGFKVYDREGTVCRTCADAGHAKPCVMRMVQGGRSTFYCKRTQR